MARQYEKKLEQLKREEELIREEQALSNQELQSDQAPAPPSTPELAAQAAAGIVMREAAASAIITALQARPKL